jgi:hypothetical protein
VLGSLRLAGWSADTKGVSEITLEVKGTNAGTLFSMALDLISGSTMPSTAPPGTPGQGPRVIAIVDGVEHTVKQYRSRRAAEKDLRRLRSELYETGAIEWAKTHGVPIGA